MIEFKINGTKYNIDKITVGKSYELYEYVSLEDLDGGFSIVSKLSGCPKDILKTLSIGEWGTLWINVVENIINIPPNFQRIIIIDDVKYGMVNIDKLSIGEFADIDVITPDINNNLHNLLAILYRPIIHEEKDCYEIEAYDPDKCRERSESFKKLHLDVAKGCTSFFLRFSRVSLDLIQDSLIVNLREMIKKNLPEELKIEINETLRELQDLGTISFVSFQERMSQRLIKLQNLELEKHSTSWLERFLKRKKKSKIKNINSK